MNDDEADLVRAVLDTLLREDFPGLRGTVVDGRLRLDHDGLPMSIPLRQEGFLSDLAVDEPRVRHGERDLTSLADVLALLSARVEPVDADGFAAFGQECREALATARTQRTHRAAALDRIAHRPRTGVAGSTVYDTLAAYLGHPVYPTGRSRHGIGADDELRYAPEHHPTFTLRWLGVPPEAVTSAGTLPDWWPTSEELGLPDHQVPFPVHPLAVQGRPVVTGPDRLAVTPTLSMRTLAFLAHPTTHLKLPLPTSTLGLRNRRTIKPGTLVDGAVTQRILAAVLDREPAFAGRILLADEQTYGHADDEMSAFLLRGYPCGLDDAEVVSLSALPARDRDGRTVLADLADRYFDGDHTALLTGYLGLLLDWQVTLLLRYGIALESHQQNVSLVLDRVGRTRIRLLFKDNDGPRIRLDRLSAAFDGTLPADAHPDLLDDRRIMVEETDHLVDVFTTITLHLCAAAIVFGVDRAGGPRLIRDLLAAAVDRHADSQDAALLRARTLHADRLPVKAMVTAGTLLSKQRSGAADVNKFYLLRGPNYLRPTAAVPAARTAEPPGHAGNTR